MWAEVFKDAVKKNFCLCTASSRNLCHRVCLQSFTTWTKILPEYYFSIPRQHLFYTVWKCWWWVCLFCVSAFAEAAGAAEADPRGWRGPGGHHGQQHGHHRLHRAEGGGGSLGGPGAHGNQSSADYQSGFSSYSNIPAEQEFPSDFCYLG